MFRQFVFLCCSSAVLWGQTALTGGLQGNITDPAGQSIRGAEIQLTSASLKAKYSVLTDESGVYRILALVPAGDYEILVTASGFETLVRDHLQIVSGEITPLNLSLAVGSQSTRLEVSSGSINIATETTELSTTVTMKQIEQLPTNGRNFVRFALIDPRVRNSSGLGGDGFAQNRLSVNGNTFRDTQWRLDGNTNYDSMFNNTPLQRLSLSSLQEFRVLTNNFNAEHGSTSTGLVITTTKSGTDQLHGEVFFFGRPSGIQSRPPLANIRVPNQLLQEGAALGGPLVRNRAYFFANYERIRQDRGSFVQGPFNNYMIGNFKDNLALAKFDFRFSDTHWISARANGHRDSNNNANDNVGGLKQPSGMTMTKGQATSGQITDTKVWGSLVNEFRAGYTNSLPSNGYPLFPQIAISRPGYSTEGGSSYSSARTEVYQLANQVSWQHGKHTVKAGGDFIRRKVRDDQFDLFGSYTFPGGAPVDGVGPTLYTQRFGVANLTYGQTQWSGFIQDSWRIFPRLTLNLGLRYDYQSIVDDYNNIGPRFGFAWDVLGTGSTIVRGGYGLYYDQPFFHGLTQRFLLGAVNAPFATYSIAPNNPAFPQFPYSYPPDQIPAGLSLAPRNLQLRGNRLLSPYTQQWTFGIQQKLGGGWVLAVDGIRSLSVKQFLQYNLNAPSPYPRTQPGQMRTVAEADATRPLYNPALGVSMYEGVAVRDVKYTTNGNSATYHALNTSLSRRIGSRFQISGHYAYSAAINSITDDHLGANPQEWNDVQRGERGPSEFNQRHRFVGNGSVILPWKIQASAFLIMASGLPVNPLTGVDNNGDGTNVDRPVGFSRNSFRGTPQRSFDISLSRQIALWETFRLELRADGFNLFNNQNYYSFNRVYGNTATPATAFLSPVAGISNTDPARQFTFGVKLLF